MFLTLTIKELSKLGFFKSHNLEHLVILKLGCTILLFLLFVSPAVIQALQLFSFLMVYGLWNVDIAMNILQCGYRRCILTS